MSPSSTSKKRVAIVGGGASGMSAAYALSLHPDLFSVTLFERSESCGGMATSTPIDADKYGAQYINDGVQGGSPQFFNTFGMFEKLGFTGTKVGFQISFGREPGKNFWSNVFPSDVIDKYQADIRRFGKVLKVIKVLEPVFALMSVAAMLRLFRFSSGFGDTIVFPLVALFMGTGNQTPFVSAAIIERLFLDPSMALFEFSPTQFLAQIPEMRAFPQLSKVYEAWKTEVESRGSVSVLTCAEVLSVDRSHKIQIDEKPKEAVKLVFRKVKGVGLDQLVQPQEGEEAQEMVFDELIMGVDADSALKVLGTDAGWMERKVLGNVKYLWDVTVTHNDREYMEKYYRMQYSDELASQKRKEAGDKDAQEQFKFAEKNFRPVYFIRSYPSDPKKIEMSFDLTNYQPQFKGVPPQGPGSTPDPEIEGELPPLESHVFQTIFLDRDGSQQLWSRDEVSKDKVIMEKWWKQQSHRWQHYAGTVPWMRFLNGRRHTHFAGAWSILNMHEIAVTSGFAAAYQLGAGYPFVESDEAKRMFGMVLAISHGSRMRKEDRKGILI